MRIRSLMVGGVVGGALQLMAGGAMAQSSVQVYGVLNTGVNYIDNEAGKNNLRESDGGMQGVRMGFRGTEDLGSGNKALYVLETGFSTDTGALGQSSATVSRIFGRLAYVGLAAPWGTLTMGRQYDSMFDLRNYSGLAYVHSYAARPWSAATLVGNNGSSNDFDRLVGTRVDNSVKLATTPVNGFSGAAMVGLGETAGGARAGRTTSVNLRYAAGPIDAGVAYTDRRDATLASTYRNWGAGASYALNTEAALTAIYTNSKWTLTNDKVDVVEVGARYKLTALLQLAGSVEYIKPNHGRTNAIFQGRHRQLNASLDYFLSQRTDVYFGMAYQKAEDGYAARIAQMAATDAQTSHQHLYEIGVRHKF